MISIKPFLLGIGWLFIAQSLAWYQTHLQFLYSWAKTNPFWVALLLGLPTSWSYIMAAKHMYFYFDGIVWPGRLIGFAVGILSFAFLAYIHLGEPMTLKVATTLFLSLLIILIQIFW
jgi:hypothetical protein